MLPPDLETTWSQEFRDGLAPAEDTWNYDLGDGSDQGLVGWGNKEQQFYIRESCCIKDGNLQITATSDGAEKYNAYYGPAKWISSKIHTARKVVFKYGYFEIIAKVPHGGGTWPAFWLLGSKLIDGVEWPECGEIDIFEGSGNLPFTVRGTVHGTGFSGDKGETKAFDFPAHLAEDFHSYGVNWSEESIEWFFDGKKYFEIIKKAHLNKFTSWPFDAEFYFILNLAMGGHFVGEIDPKITNAELLVKSIKHYSVSGKGYSRKINT